MRMRSLEDSLGRYQVDDEEEKHACRDKDLCRDSDLYVCEMCTPD